LKSSADSIDRFLHKRRFFRVEGTQNQTWQKRKSTCVVASSSSFQQEQLMYYEISATFRWRNQRPCWSSKQFGSKAQFMHWVSHYHRLTWIWKKTKKTLSIYIFLL